MLKQLFADYLMSFAELRKKNNTNFVTYTFIKCEILIFTKTNVCFNKDLFFYLDTNLINVHLF